MDFLTVHFQVSGLEINVLVPIVVSAVISFFTSMGGVSGAFLLLPFQMSVLNYTAPSVSGTNHVFNIVAIPSGVYRYIKEGRMAWPLTWVIVLGTLPGVFLGYYLRVLYLPDPKAFKFFVGCVLLYIGIKLLKDVLAQKSSSGKTLDKKLKETAEASDAGVVKTISVSIKKIEYEFYGERFSFNPIHMFNLALIVGVVGGAYGIGGGSIIAPVCIAFFKLPVYTIAGAALMGTFITSVAGAGFFSLLPSVGGVSAMPDWPLGILFGVGGCIGMYLGAMAQRYVPQKAIKWMLAGVIIFLALRYITQYWF